ncbi:MAG: family 43 glycosylhydrolase [Bacteroidales bacterium]|nr:family 43 glycosylhydrolase [Bacteroidales bacterium]
MRCITTISAFLLALALTVTDLSSQCTFTNPLSAQSQPDPFVTYHNGYYYYTFTTGSDVQVRKSATLQGITAAPAIRVWGIEYEPSLTGAVWAPELHYLNGKWYIYTTAKDASCPNCSMRVIVLEGNDPQGQFAYRGIMAKGIDATVLNHNGALYMIWMRDDDGNVQHLNIAPMTSPTTLGAARTRISTYTFYDWEVRDQVCNEGPQILQRNGKIFLTYSASASWTQWYCLGMYTCSDGNVMNASSWVKSPVPVFQKSDANGVYGPGHASFTTSPDGREDWICYHGMSTPTAGWEGRQPRIQRFTWRADGTPDFGIPVANGVQIACPGNGNFVQLESFNFPSQYIRHANSRGRIDANVNPLGDCQFKIVPGLANSAAVSLESANFPGYFLRHRNGEIWLDANNGSALFKNDATWYIRAGLANAAASSIESYNFPGRYIRHSNSLLYSESVSDALGRSDATFYQRATSVTGNSSSGGPVFIEAENYASMNGVQTETCSEGGLNVGWIDAGDWMVWNVNLLVSGTYTVEYRVASLNGGGTIQLERAGGNPVYGSVAVPKTSGWQNWTTIKHNVSLSAGQQQIAIYVPAGGYNINWLMLTPGFKAAEEISYKTEGYIPHEIYPNPASGNIFIGADDNAMIYISDLNGRKISQGKVVEKSFDVSALPDGLYVVTIVTPRRTSSQKLLINKSL